LAEESRIVPVLVEQHFGNPRLAANYASGDQIRYRAGSPIEHGIADNSSTTVLSVDARANMLTVKTLDTSEVAYNPALTRTLTGQSTVFREESRDLAVAERIQLTQSDQSLHVRSGDFATVERIGEDNSLSVRLDNGKSIELDSERARHIDYGYAVDGLHSTRADRVLITGDALQLAQQEKMLSHLSPQTHNLALYTSDSRELAADKAIPGIELGVAVDGIASNIANLSVPSVPVVELEELGIGL
jgi:hypothetical protein